MPHGLMTHLEDGAIEREGLILAALARHVELVPLLQHLHRKSKQIWSDHGSD